MLTYCSVIQAEERVALQPHGSPKAQWLMLPQNCSMGNLLTETTNREVHYKQERGVKCNSSLQQEE